jgi:hypothetical protein
MQLGAITVPAKSLERSIMKTRNISTDQVMKLYNSGSDALSISKALGISRHTVYYHLHKGGINRHDKVFVSTDEVVSLYQSGLGPKDIAAKLGCNVCTAYAHLNQAGIYLDGRGNQPYQPSPYVLEALDPIWAAEFRGFFMADGSAFMVKASRSKKYASGKMVEIAPRYYPVLAIIVRLDDREAMLDIATKLGGRTYESRSYSKNRNGSPKIQWSIHGWRHCRAVIESTLLNGSFPAKKCRDVELMYQAILDRYSMPQQLNQEQRLKIQSYYYQLKGLKRFQL